MERIPLQTFDVLVAVRVHNGPPLKPEHVELLFDQDLSGIEGYPGSSIRTRTVDVKAT